MANIITPEFRATFVSIMRPTSSKNDDGSVKKKYKIQAAFPPTCDLSALKAEAAEAARGKWGDKAAKMQIRSPFRLNEELDNPVAGIGDDWTIVTFSSGEEYFNPKGHVVSAKKGPDGLPMAITDEEDVYPGAWYRVQTTAGTYETAGNKGVKFYLNNVQKLRDDEQLGAGRCPANKAFEAVEDTGGKTAGSIFG